MAVNTGDPTRLGNHLQLNEMARLIGSHDWSKTAVGASERWSPALRLIVNIMCASGFPMAVRWGPDFTLIYNEGYKPILADKHPWALGRPFREAWPEVQSELLPLHEDILCGKSPGVFSEDRPLTIQRRGDVWETAHFTISYSPVPDETSPTGVGGVLVTAVETSDRKRAEDALRHLNQTLEAQVAERVRERDEIWRVSQDMLLVIDREGILRAVNPAWTRTLGYLPEELIGNRFDVFVEPDDVGRTHAAIEHSSREALPSFENRYRHKDGSWRNIAWTAAPSGELIYCVARDVTEEKRREWRASKLVGVNVYNEANEKIGDINEVILDKSGRVANVVLGVGGFLGMGEHYVAVAYDKLKWVNEPSRSTVATSTAPANTPATTAADGTKTTTGTATTTTRIATEYWYPDHAVYNATKEQLKSMPQFKY